MNIDPTQATPVVAPLKNEAATGKKNNNTTSTNDSPSTVVNLSSSAQSINSKADGLAPYEEVRQNLVDEAKNELDNWDGISDNQVDDIMDKMFNELN